MCESGYLDFFLVDCLEVARPLALAVLRAGFPLIPRARLTGSIALPVPLTMAWVVFTTALAASFTVLPILVTVVFPHAVFPFVAVDLAELIVVVAAIP